MIKIKNDYDSYITITNEFFERSYTVVNKPTLNRFRQVFGDSLMDVFQETGIRDKLNDDLSPKEIEKTNLILKFENGRYVEMLPSKFVSFNRLKM